jgi:hypothetical protein
LAEVRLQEGETLENALKRFKRKVLQGKRQRKPSVPGMNLVVKWGSE